jgi:hypothetical protein
MIGGEVGELRAADDIADGIDPAVRGPEAGIDLHALVGEGDARGLEAEIGHSWLPPCRHEKMGALEAARTFHSLDFEGDARPRRLGAQDLMALIKGDAIGDQGAAEHGHQLGIVLGQQARHLHQADLGAQPAEGLGQLAADGAAAHEQEMVG